ncbi:MAG: hypothetical protein K8R21_02245 [Leptospira sp.]|nr:hypothetical protein [Leptospira sp.]
MVQLIPKLDEVFEYSRMFTREEILAFANITGDRGDHHVNPAKRVMAQGLLVASIVTKLGGDMNYVSRKIDMEFLLPVYQDEVVIGRMTVTNVLLRESRIKLSMKCEVFDSAGKLVIRGSTTGQIWINQN